MEKQEYVGHVPSNDFYDPKGMSDSIRKEFEVWHKDGHEFVFSEGNCLLSIRCEIRLLKEGYMKFQENLKDWPSLILWPIALTLLRPVMFITAKCV